MKDETKENNSVMKCCICNNENIGEFIVIEDKKYHLNCITNLQEEVEDLREDNYAYHQLMKIQNKREYRSKFLKEFQEEFGTNTFPDYDEIYKRYDKLKKENEKLKELCDNYEEEHSTTFNEWKETITDKYQTLKDLQEEKDKYKDVIDKIKEYVGELRLFDNESVEFEISNNILKLLEEVE